MNDTTRPPGAEDENQVLKQKAKVQWPKPADQLAFHGLAGEFVRLTEPHTEADPIAVLVQFLVAFGSVIGRTAHFVAEQSPHHCNLFAVIVGDTSKARKGSSWSHVRHLYEQLDPDWATDRVASGLSSGEGLIFNVRDSVLTRERVKERGEPPRYEEVESDPGETDKRLFVVEEEFAKVLKVADRKESTLSPIIRQAWDTGDLRTLTKTSPIRATGAHISIVGHITRDELRRHLSQSDQTNGFANRFLWLCVRRSKLLPEGGRSDTVDFVPLLDALSSCVKFAGQVRRMDRDSDAKKLWADIYPELSEGKLGLLGAVTSRAESQVMRLACVYAVLDCSNLVRPQHLRAALALWTYCEDSARHIFGDATGNPTADEILRALKGAHPGGLSKNMIREDVFQRNKSAEQIDDGLHILKDYGLALVKRESTGGRPAEVWYAILA